MEHPFTDERIAQLPLRELTREGGEGLLLERIYIEVEQTNWSPKQKRDVMCLADDIVHAYHAGDKRDDKTYATHVLRVACRVLSPDHFNIRDDPELIMAALLHDVVEDHPERLLGVNVVKATTFEQRVEHRELALAVIAERYGERVAGMVSTLSNPIYDKTDEEEDERQEYYRDHIRTLMNGESDARIIKISDFIDNCLGLEFNPDHALRYKLARKYQPLLPSMLAFLPKSAIPDGMKQKIADELFYANELCNTIVASRGRRQRLGVSATAQTRIDQKAEQWRGGNVA